MDYTIMHVFVCLCHPLLPTHTTNKLGPKSSSCVFIGYATNKKGYHCLDRATGRVNTSKHVKLLEEMFPYPQKLPTPIHIEEPMPLLPFLDLSIKHSPHSLSITDHLPPTLPQPDSNEHPQSEVLVEAYFPPISSP